MSMEIEEMLVPGMLDLNVVEALERATSLCVEMRESADYCKRLLDRLLFLRDELPKQGSKMNPVDRNKVVSQFANTILLVIHFLTMFSKKKLLQRIAASRLIREGVDRLHHAIDGVFAAAGLSSDPEMTGWKAQAESDMTKLRAAVRELARDRSKLMSDLSASELEETLTELKFEIDSEEITRECTEMLQEVLTAVVEHVEGAAIPVVPVWYIRRDDVVVGELIDMGTFGEIYKGKWGVAQTQVAVKMLYLGGPETQMEFLREAAVWFGLDHPNVVKMYGGCHVGEPLFFVSEYAKYGNFSEYFDRSENESKMWTLFYQAAQGLSYLHSKRIVHADIKCNNLLVGDDGTARLCDFGFSYVADTTLTTLEKVVREQPSTTRWKAPECLLQFGAAANPTFESDVYSLGMSIIEAKICGVPWGFRSDDDIIDELGAENGYPRPDGGVFTEKEWGLVQCMTAFYPDDRLSLREVIQRLAELAREEEEAGEYQWQAEFQVEGSDHHADENGESQADRIVSRKADNHEHLFNCIQNLPLLGREARGVLLYHVRQVVRWRKQEKQERAIWDDFPKTIMCINCGDFNPCDSQFCCDCGNTMHGYRKDAEFRFVVTNPGDLEQAISAFEDLHLEADKENQRPATLLCFVCGKPHPLGNRFCGECGALLDLDRVEYPNIDSRAIRDALGNEINSLKVMLTRSEEEVRWLKHREPLPKMRICSRCDDQNSEEEAFCRECGADIEIIRRHRL